MTKTRVDPGWAWDHPYHYSQAFRVGDLLFISGQAAIAPDGSIVGKDDFDAQARQAFANLEAVLRCAGAELRDVVKVTVFLTDVSHFPRVVELRRQYFSPPYPADTTVQVEALALPELMVEIEAVAWMGR